MNFNEYQQLAERTANNGQSGRQRLANFALGLAGETGETVDYIKKVLFHGHQLDIVKLKKELGDCLWYIATIATTVGVPLQDIANLNIDKLRERYPEGFSKERSVNREVDSDGL